MAVLDRLLADLRAIFAARLTTLVVYGRHATNSAPPGLPIHSLALVDEVEFADLDACARAAGGWHSDGLAVPLIMGQREFSRSLDSFPVEFGAIIASHRVIYGDDPFGGMAVAEQDLRRAIELDIKGHLLHLREAYIERRGEPAAVARLVEASAAALRTLAANVARLDGEPAGTPAALAAHLTSRLGDTHGRTLSSVLALGESGMGVSDGARLFPAYLTAVEALASYVDAWKR